MLRVIELSKAAVEDSSTQCTREGRVAPSLNYPVRLWAKMHVLPCFSRSGWLAAHSPHGHHFPAAMAVPPQRSRALALACTCSHGIVPALMCWQWLFPCFSCFLNILLFSLRNFLSGKKLSLIRRTAVFGLFTPLSLGQELAKRSFTPHAVIS